MNSVESIPVEFVEHYFLVILKMKGESCHVLQSCSGDVPDDMSGIGLKKCHACYNTVFNIAFI